MPGSPIAMQMGVERYDENNDDDDMIETLGSGKRE